MGEGHYFEIVTTIPLPTDIDKDGLLFPLFETAIIFAT
jgi:hypothetical protein